jgi:hypothetical protein
MGASSFVVALTSGGAAKNLTSADVVDVDFRVNTTKDSFIGIAAVANNFTTESNLSLQNVHHGGDGDGGDNGDREDKVVTEERDNEFTVDDVYAQYFKEALKTRNAGYTVDFYAHNIKEALKMLSTRAICSAGLFYSADFNLSAAFGPRSLFSVADVSTYVPELNGNYEVWKSIKSNPEYELDFVWSGSGGSVGVHPSQTLGLPWSCISIAMDTFNRVAVDFMVANELIDDPWATAQNKYSSATEEEFAANKLVDDPWATANTTSTIWHEPKTVQELELYVTIIQHTLEGWSRRGSCSANPLQWNHVYWDIGMGHRPSIPWLNSPAKFYWTRTPQSGK